uniref:Uncharacterized protein n=1 Tax=Aegilops tauschii subsp. strangulata TaxID=200361 RepID=A0A453T904_AEGTS
MVCCWINCRKYVFFLRFSTIVLFSYKTICYVKIRLCVEHIVLSSENEENYP